MVMREEMFGRYVLLSRLGYGGMAEVFLARTEGFGGFAKRLAIKRLLPCYSEDKQTVDLLADEAKITVRLAHPNIVQVFDFGRVDDSYFIAMEYVDGLDLKSLVEIDEDSSQPMPLDLALYVIHCVLGALEYAHNRADEYGKPLNIIHRDVSPQNVLISRHGEVKLTDFGVARAAISCHVSVIGDIRGKFSYMPPEQATGGEIDQRVDLFAAGAILYELLTGKQPYRSVSSGQQIVQLFQNVEPPSQINRDLPAAVDELALKALAREREHRFPSAGEFAAAVSALLERRSDPLGLQRRLARLVEDRMSDAGSSSEPAQQQEEPRREISALETQQGFLLPPQGLRGVVSGEIHDEHAGDNAMANGGAFSWQRAAVELIAPPSVEVEELDHVYIEEDSLDAMKTAAYESPQADALGLAPTELHAQFPPVPADLEDSTEAMPTLIAGPEMRLAAPPAAIPPSASWTDQFEREQLPAVVPGRRAPPEYGPPSAGAVVDAAPPRRFPAAHFLHDDEDSDIREPDSMELRTLDPPPALSPSRRWAAMSGQRHESSLALYLTIGAVVLVLFVGVLLAFWVAMAD